MAIPLPRMPFDAFMGGMESSSNLINQLMQQKQNQQRLNQDWQQHLRNAAIREAQEQRLNELLPYQIGQYKQQSELHPFKISQMQQQKNLAPLEYKALEAKVAAENQKAQALQRYGSQRPSAAVQEALMLFGDPSDPRFQQYIYDRNKLYMPNEKQMAEDEQLKSSPNYEQMQEQLQNAIPMNSLPPGTQNLYRKQMNEELSQIDKAKQVVHAIGLARELTANNPDMYKKAINIIANPEATPGVIEKSLTTFLPKKEVSAFMEAHKLYSDILTKQAQLNNMSRSVYALKLQQQAKPQVKNPDEVNEQIFRNMEYEIGPQLAREKALLYAMKHNQYLPYTKKYSLESGEPNQIPNKVHGPTSIDMMKGIDSQGNEIDVHPSRRMQFEKAGGRIL